MAADDLSTANLPPVAWTSNTSAQESSQEPGEKEKKLRKLQPKPDAKTSRATELEFETTEHELDSIA